MNARHSQRDENAIAAQSRYYDLYAPEYVNPLAPSNLRSPGSRGANTARDLIDDLSPEGDLLELACGTGGFTADLARHATSVTAIDASPQMLARNRMEVDLPNVRYIRADIFDWRPDAAYDVIFFGFWLSHVPPTKFEDFWQLVRTCLRPGGRVAFVDEDDRSRTNDDVRSVEGVPLARRALVDGRTLDVIKVFWKPDDLHARLDALGWNFSIQPVHDIFMYGVGTSALV